MYVLLITILTDRKLCFLLMLRIRIRMDPHQVERYGRIRNRIWILMKVISCIRIRIHWQMTSQNVWNMSLFEHFFNVLSLNLEARVRIRIKVVPYNLYFINFWIKFYKLNPIYYDIKYKILE
jgi:hypothetical protein